MSSWYIMMIHHDDISWWYIMMTHYYYLSRQLLNIWEERERDSCYLRRQILIIWEDTFLLVEKTNSSYKLLASAIIPAGAFSLRKTRPRMLGTSPFPRSVCSCPLQAFSGYHHSRRGFFSGKNTPLDFYKLLAGTIIPAGDFYPATTTRPWIFTSI